MKESGNSETVTTVNENSAESKKKNFFERLKSVFLPTGLAVFTVVFFGPLELCANNVDAIRMSALDSLPIIFLVSIVAFCALSLLAAIPWGKGNTFTSVLIFAVSIAAYIQGNFLNTDLTLLKGYEFPMEDYAKKTALNVLIWLLVIAAVFFIAKKLKEKRARVLGIACVVIILMQSVALVPRFFSGSYKKPGFDFSTANERVLSKNDNTLILVLDCFSNVTLEKTLAKYPDTLDGLEDFTYYRNYSSAYKGTFPSMAIILTATDYDASKPYSTFFEDAWCSKRAETFYGKLHEMNYTVDVICGNGYITDKIENIEGKLDNIEELSEQIKSVNYAGVVYELGKLSAYRYSPYGLKRFFVSYPMDFENLVHFTNINNTIGALTNTYDFDLYRRLTSEGITLTDKNRMIAFHLSGAHGPYVIGKDFEYIPDASGCVEDQASGEFKIVKEYITQMKELGIYDNATIVVLADHGDYEEKLGTSSAIMFYKPKNASSEAITVSNAPITYYQLMSSLAEDMGIGDTALYGRPFSAVSETEVIERTLYLWNSERHVTAGRYGALLGYKYSGDINEQSFDGEPDIVLDIYDSFY